MDDKSITPESAVPVSPLEATAPVVKPDVKGDMEKTTGEKVVKEAELVASNILSLISKLDVLNSIVNQITGIVSVDGNPRDQVAAVRAALSAGGNAYAVEEAQAEAKPSVAVAATGFEKAAIDSAPSALALALAIPLLVNNPQVGGAITSFFTGFLEGMGLSTNAVTTAIPYIKVILGVLAVAFTMKALGSVLTVFDKMKELATVLGIAGQEVKDGSEDVAKKNEKNKKDKDIIDKDKKDINKEKDDVKKGGEKARGEVKKTKDEIKKAKRAGKGKNFISRFKDKMFHLAEKVTPKLIDLSKNLVKALPMVGTILGIGLVLYDLYSIGSDVYDVFFGDDEEDKPEPEDKATPSSTAPEAGAKVNASPAEQTAKPATPAPPPATTPTTPATKAAAPASPLPPTVSAAAPIQPPTPPAVVVLTRVEEKAKEVNAKSVENERTERDIAMAPNSTTINVNNNTTVAAPKKTAVTSRGTTYSVTVGV